MANGNSFFAFIAGAITGAALLLLANTEKGEEVVEDLKEKGSEAFNNGRAAVMKGLDKLEDALSAKVKEEQEEEPAQAAPAADEEASE
ncbi:MAG: YtxH domain-containing protein [Bacteroidales bacterium]|nr:YtxH domain-containing protein [Bacteroidales bacterium]